MGKYSLKIFSIDLANSNYLKSIFVIFLTIFTGIIGLFIHKQIIQLGYSQFENYTLVMTWMILLSNIFLIGNRLNYLSLINQKNKLIIYFIGSSLLVMLLSIALGFISLKAIQISYPIAKNEFSPLIILLYCAYGISISFSFLLNALKKTIISSISIITPSIFFFLLLKNNIGENIFSLFLLSFSLNIIILFSYIIFIEKVYKVKFSLILETTKKHIIPGINYAISNIIDALANKISVLFFVYIISDLKSMVCVSIAFSLSKIAMTILSSINHVYSPVIASNVNKSSKKKRITFNNMRIISLILTSIALVLFISIGKNVVIFFYTQEYIESLRLTLILISGQLIHSIFNPYIIHLKLIGKAIQISKIKLVFTILMVITNYFLYDIFGIDLIAFSYVFFIYILWNFFVLLSFKLEINRAHSSIG